MAGFNQQTFDTLPVKLIAGRLPKNSQEVVVPAHVAANGGVKYTVGETLALTVGERLADGRRLNQQDAYKKQEGLKKAAEKTIKLWVFASDRGSKASMHQDIH